LGVAMVMHGYATNGKYKSGPFGTPGKWIYQREKTWVTCHKGF
ncbi:unnamed protein product, partial [marine sediment metagenome]